MLSTSGKRITISAPENLMFRMLLLIALAELIQQRMVQNSANQKGGCKTCVLDQQE